MRTSFYTLVSRLILWRQRDSGDRDSPGHEPIAKSRRTVHTNHLLGAGHTKQMPAYAKPQVSRHKGQSSVVDTWNR